MGLFSRRKHKSELADQSKAFTRDEPTPNTPARRRGNTDSSSKSRSRSGHRHAHGENRNDDEKDAAEKAREGHDGETIPNNLDPARKPVNRQLQSREAFLLNSLLYGLEVPTGRTSTWDRRTKREHEVFLAWILREYEAGTLFDEKSRLGTDGVEPLEKEGLSSRKQDSGDLVVTAPIHASVTGAHDPESLGAGQFEGKQFASGEPSTEAPKELSGESEKRVRKGSGSAAATTAQRHRVPHLQRRTTFGVNNDLTSHAQELELLPDPQKRRLVVQRQGKDTDATVTGGGRAHHRKPFIHRSLSKRDRNDPYSASGNRGSEGRRDADDSDDDETGFISRQQEKLRGLLPGKSSDYPGEGSGGDDAMRQTHPGYSGGGRGKGKEPQRNKSNQTMPDPAENPSRRQDALAMHERWGEGGSKALERHAQEARNTGSDEADPGYIGHADVARPDLGKPRGADPEEPAHRYEVHDPTAKDRIKGATDYLEGKARFDQDIVSKAKAEFRGETSDR
ncbi:hypothetical protein PYCC9005_005042 [Savitreella phatthalungensis]